MFSMNFNTSTVLGLFLFGIMFALQLACLVSCVKVYRLTKRHDEFRKADSVQMSWKPFIRPPSDTLPPLWVLVLRAITTGPIRFLVSTLCIIFTTSVAVILPPDFGMRLASYTGPFGSWFAGVSRVNFVGVPAPARLAPLVCGNHISWLDFIVLGSTGMFGFVMSEAVTNAPLVGAGFKKMALHVGSIVLDRSSAHSRDSAKTSITHMLERMQSTNSSERLLIFPEGTLTNGEYVVPFKLGAFESLRPAQPIRLEFSNPHYSCADLDTFTAVLFHMCLSMTVLTITWCDVVTPTALDTPATFAGRVRSELVRKSAIKETNDGGFRDHLALHASG